MMYPHEPQGAPSEPQQDQECVQPPEAEKRHFESVGEAVHAAKEDACNRARETAPKIKSAVSDAVHDLAYGGAFGAVFVGAFAMELVPKPLREGVAKGAKAGRDKARHACDKVREVMTPKPEERRTEEVVIDLDGPAPAGA